MQLPYNSAMQIEIEQIADEEMAAAIIAAVRAVLLQSAPTPVKPRQQRSAWAIAAIAENHAATQNIGRWEDKHVSM
jgi:hypothetical protein